MTETEFRVKHSELIEYYQLIEMRLKGICAALLADGEKGWIERLGDYEADPFGLLLRRIKELQEQKQVTLFTQEDYAMLDDMRKTRNYWVHQCFGLPNPVIFHKGEVRSLGHKAKLISSLNEAIDWDIKLTEIFRTTHSLGGS